MIKIKKDKKGYLQVSFQWIFAIIVGAIILFLAIYGVTKFMNLEQGKQDIQKARQLNALLNPTETSFESGSKIILETNVKTEIYNDCNDYGEFGEQKIGIKQENFDKTSTMKNTVTSKNKYIFSNNPVKSDRYFYIFTKPFNFPFKIADLTYLTSKENIYCLEGDFPKERRKDLIINQSNIIVDCKDKVLNSEQTTEVCFKNSENFGNPDCNIEVDYLSKVIGKQGQEIEFYNNALMYAGIFSTPENYECQLKRLMKKTEKLAEVYIEKSNIITSSTDCGNKMKPELLALKDFAKNYNDSSDLKKMRPIINKLENENDKSWECRLW